MFHKLLRSLRGPPELTEAERRVLEREHGRVQDRIDQVVADMGKVACASCVKQENPYHKRKIAQLRALEKTKADIEWKLGGEPEIRRSRSKRAQIEAERRRSRA